MKIDILGVQIDSLTKKEALERFQSFITSNKSHYIVTPNPEIIMATQKDEEFKEILNKADLALADGFGLKLASLYLKQPLKQRIPGVDFIWEIAKLAEDKNYIIYLFGAREGIAKRASNELQKKFPHLIIKGAESGFRNKERIPDEEIIEDIKGKKPQILLVALGFPKQEKWIVRNLPLLPSVKVAMGVGGSFDFIAKKVPRAPKILRSLGLEWFFRLIIQPWRTNRIINATLKFSWAVIKSKQ